MSMREKASRGIVRCGRKITAHEIEAARETVRLCRGLSRRELAETICEHWGWVTASGSLKLTACLNVLEGLEQQGELQLPPKKKKPGTERVRGLIAFVRSTIAAPWIDAEDLRRIATGPCQLRLE